MEQLLSHETHNNHIDSDDYLNQVKQEPPDIDVDVKNELFEYEQNLNNIGETYTTSINIWSSLVERCRFLLQEEHGHSQMNSTLITKILIKESNELLQQIVNFFKECCNPISEEELMNESLLEVGGLLVNCLQCHPKNNICYYKISSDVPKTYLETLFSPLPNEIEELGDDFKDDYFLPLVPEIEVDIKKENSDVKPNDKKTKRDSKTKLKKEHVCDICGKTFKQNKDYKAHVSGVHEKKKPFKCNKCGDSYKYRNGLIVHRNSGKCPGVPRNENKWIKWGNTGGGTPLDPKCLHPDCIGKDHERFTYAGIMNHIIDVHSPGADDSKNLQCPDCPKRFPMLNVLKYHQEKQHGAKSKICTLCGKLVSRMKMHMSIAHSNEKKYQCDKCDFQCKVSSILKRHMYTHSDNPMEGRKHKCEICQKAFFTKQEIKQHLLTHGRIKPYQCKLCSGTFSNFSGHRQHMMKTHGLKFTCDICGKDSSSMKGLGTHKRDKHGIPL